MATATLLLPARARLGGTLPADVAKALGQGDRSEGEAGETAQLRRHFQLLPDHWPVAALTRQLDAGDAGSEHWLRVDPAHVAPDMNGARLLSYGEGLGLDADDARALLPALKPLFGDAGFLLDAPHPARWYLRLPREAQLPQFTSPHAAVGDDLFAHLPPGDAGRRWRALFNEVQVILHHHPHNQRRAAAGMATVNALWFWGAGRMPHSVTTRYRQVKSHDELLRALAAAAGAIGQDAGEIDALVDLRQLRSLDSLGNEALRPLLLELRRGELDAIMLDFQDGAGFALHRGQRWRFWRRPLQLAQA